MNGEQAPEFEPDWSPLSRAFHDALWTAKVVLPRKVERALVAELIDALIAEGVTLTESDPP